MRRLALAFLLLAACLAAPQTVGAQQPPEPLRVYVMVLDGLRPSEVTPDLMPTLSALRAQGTWYEQARAVFVGETLPNHASMMTGVTPQRHGITGNSYWEPNPNSAQRFDVGDEGPKLLEADTLTTSLENRCEISTSTVLSKTYLWQLFSGEPANPNDPNPQRQADFHWQPSPTIPQSDHAPDAVTMNTFRTWVADQAPGGPKFSFVNLGDIDRSGHVDQTGTSGGVSAARAAAIADTDAQLAQFVDELHQAGTWDETVLIFTSDHGMDWGTQDRDMHAETAPSDAGYHLDARGDPGKASPGGLGVGDYYGSANGGAASLYVEEEADVAPIAELVAALPGVEFVATKEPIPSLENPTLEEVGLDHTRAGDIVAFAKPGYAERDTLTTDNPLPGNHGHPITQHSVLMVAGGHPVLDDTPESVGGETVYDPTARPFASPTGGPGNLSVAPTVAALFGIGQPAGGYDRPPLYEAFENHALAAHPACGAATVDDLLYPRPASATPTRVPLVPAYAECSAPDSEHVAPLALPSCSSARRESDLLTTSSAGRGYGFLQLRAIPGDPLTTADEADLTITTEVTDVRAQGGSADYAGRLLLRLGLRVTDGASGPPDGAPATVRDTEFSTPLDCAPTGNEPLGSKCNLSTSTDTLVPGFAKEGMRAVISTPSIEVTDLGADSSLTPASGTCPPACGSGDEKVFLRQGLFTP